MNYGGLGVSIRSFRAYSSINADVLSDKDIHKGPPKRLLRVNSEAVVLLGIIVYRINHAVIALPFSSFISLSFPPLYLQLVGTRTYRLYLPTCSQIRRLGFWIHTSMDAVYLWSPGRLSAGLPFPAVMSLKEPVIERSHHHLSSSKRKLDDYGPADDGFLDLVSVRMRKGESNAVNSSNGPSDRTSYSGVGARMSDARPVPCRLQFFVRMISEGNTLVVQANPDDTVESIHERIRAITGIPVIEQRLIYRGKQLQWEQSLAECSIQNDAGLQLVGRMRSTGHPLAWRVINDMISSICESCREQSLNSSRNIKSLLMKFLEMTPKDDRDSAAGHLQILISSSAPAALVMLYMSSNQGNKRCADDTIRHFLTSIQDKSLKYVHSQCARIVLEFCELLSKTSNNDSLYRSCRSTLALLVEAIGIAPALNYYDNPKESIGIKDVLPFVSEIAKSLSKDLVSSMESPGREVPLASDVRDFASFLHPLHKAIVDHAHAEGAITLPLPADICNSLSYAKEIESLYVIFNNLYEKMDQCLQKMEGSSIMKGGGGESEIQYFGWSQYLAILKELHSISKIYFGAEERMLTMLSFRNLSLCALIVRHGNRSDDNGWLLEHKKLLNFEARRHLAMMMFPEVKEDYEEVHEMLIDRSQLLAESFEYIARADPEALHSGLFMEFKNEEATGPGVLREWFFLVCQAIFNPENALFVACPNDRRRFFPNPGKLA